MSRRFLITLLTVVAIGIIGAIAIMITKGYRISPQTGIITGTGILSVNSEPDQASVYLDDHLTTATNANINALVPKTYDVRIVKEGYITWEKKIEVKEGLVSEVKATLFRTIPTVYPITYTGAQMSLISPDNFKMIYVVPVSDPNDPITLKKGGVWVWETAERQFNIRRGNEPRQIALSNGTDWTKASFRWSPDSTQVLATFPDRQLLLETDRLNDPPKDVTLQLAATISAWDEQEKTRNTTRLNSIKDVELRKVASSSAYLNWSPDETRILYSQDGKDNFKVADLTSRKTYDLPKVNYYSWLPDGLHLVLVESDEPAKTPIPTPAKTVSQSITQSSLPNSRISIVEFDGFNRSEIYIGTLDPKSIFVWPDSSRLIVVSSFPTSNASKPNLFGINLK